LRVIFDTNVFVAAFAAQGLCSKLLERANKHDFVLYISPFIIDELKRVLETKISLSTIEIEEAISLIAEVAKVINPEKTGIKVEKVCRDKDDDNIPACVLAVNAHYLVIGDKDLLELKKYKKTKIIPPRTFELLF
jgi:putative PIN family toxin of toxin-antitoxin system